MQVIEGEGESGPAKLPSLSEITDGVWNEEREERRAELGRAKEEDHLANGSSVHGSE